MRLLHIPVFVAISLTASLIAGGRWRNWLILATSVTALFWLQPGMPIRNLDFWLPLGIITLTVWTWAITRPAESRMLTREDWLSGAIIAGVVLIIGALRYIDPVCCVTATRPPGIGFILIALPLVGLSGFLLGQTIRQRRWVVLGLLALMIGLLIVLKNEYLTRYASGLLRALMQQSADQASAFDIRWLGISYVIFRLVHVLRDFQGNRFAPLSLQEFVNYVIFFPAITAGPIDRADRFVKDYRSPVKLSWPVVYEAGTRILWGVFKKFALADTLALISLNDANAAQATSTVWLWVTLYAFVFRLYLEFSGYTDIAIGLGLLLGIRLPENFDRPFLKPNLTELWNSWHMTLGTWFRAYYFHPVSRGIMRRWKRIPTINIILFCQVTTMVLVGLWHGITWNLFIWGAWQGLGLFIHNRWANLSRARFSHLEQSPRLKLAFDITGALLAFHFFLLGLVWFAVTSTDRSWTVFLTLFGLS